jgi:DNA-binding transcriptional MerR regulator
MNNAKTSKAMSDENAFFPIRTVSELTGVNAITLRAWERRYGLIQPHRTEKGHRLYSMQDVDFIKDVLDVLKRGVSIGRVRQILGTSKEPLQRRPDIDATPRVDAAEFDEDVEENLWEDYQARMQTCVSIYDAPALDKLHYELVSQYPINLMGQYVLLPLLENIKNKAQGLMAVSGEYHFFLQYLRTRISSNYLKDNLDMGNRKHAKRLLMACLDNDVGEIHLLLLGADLVTQSCHSIFLGNQVQADALPLAATRSEVDGVVLYHHNWDELSVDHLQVLAMTLDVPVLLMGNMSASLAEQIESMSTVHRFENNSQQVQAIIGGPA